MITQKVMCFVEGRPVQQIKAVFEFQQDRPYAVRLHLSASDHPPVQWVFARDLLIEGLTCPVGLGDVRVDPGTHTVGITLTSPGGTLGFAVNRNELTSFCARIIAEVPVGTESGFFDLDHEIQRFADSLARP